MKVKCSLCCRKLHDGFDAKVKHLVKHHPLFVIQKLWPYIGKPENAFLLGRELASVVKHSYLGVR